MHDHDALSAMKLAELKEIAKKLGLKKADTLKKQDLIAKILEAQATKGDGKSDEEKQIGPSFRDEKAQKEMAARDESILITEPEATEEPEDDDDDDEDEEDDDGDDDEEGDDDEVSDEGNGSERNKTAEAPPATAAEPPKREQGSWRERRERMRAE